MPVRAEMLMGTTVTIDAAGAESDAAVDRAFEWFRSVEHVCTRFDPSSELCQLSIQPGRPIAVSRLLFEAVQFALHIAHATGGAFDPTVGATMQQRGFNREHRSGAVVPSLVDSCVGVTYRDVVIDSGQQTILLKRPLLLDLGAVAKGLAIDLATRELESCEGFAIDAGGDLYLGGLNRDGHPWSIGIRHPRHAGACIASVRVSDQAVCTSGDYERGANPASVFAQSVTVNRNEDRRGGRSGAPITGGEHHIVDPRSGSSPRDVASVTVIAPSAMVADALATGAFVMGAERGLVFLEQMEVEGLIITPDLELFRTSGWSGFE